MNKPISHCAVANCNTKYDGRIGFYRFPKADLARCLEWLNQCGRLDLIDKNINYYNLRICGKHFEPIMFTNIHTNRLLSHAKPTLYLPEKSDNIPRQGPGTSIQGGSIPGPSSNNNNNNQLSEVSIPDEDLCDFKRSASTSTTETQTSQSCSANTPRKNKLRRNIFQLRRSFPIVYNENGMHDLRHTTFDRVELSVIQENISADDDNADNHLLGEVELPPNAESVEKDDENLKEASFSTGKPYFKSIKCYMPDCNSLKEVCRICFCPLTKEEQVIKLYGEEISMQDEIHIKNMLKLVLPDMDLEMYPNIVICTKCTELLAYSYQLKKMWLSTEAKLQKILEKKKTVIRRDADLVIIKKDIKNKTLSEIEHNYADTSMNLKEQTSEELKITGSILENLLTTDNEDSLKTVKLFHGEPSDSSPSKPVHSQKGIKKKIWGLGPYMCEQCGQIYTHWKKLRTHLLSHRKKVKKPRQKEREVMCEICGKLFLTSARLKSHRRIHSEPKCSTCGKQFEHIKALNRHIFCAHRRGSFQCHLCGKQYPYATSLRNHLILHNPKKKVHACDICDKKFFVPSRLRKHLRTHVTDRLWSCNYCGKTVKYEHSLQRHIRIYHMNQAEFVCEFCNRPYWKKVDLLKHRIRIHGCSMETRKLQEDSLLENEADFCSAVQIGVQECEI